MTRALPHAVAMSPLLAVLLMGCTTPHAPRTEAGTDGQDAVRQLDVGLTDFAIAASATTVPPVPVQLRVTNAGATPHDLRVEGAGPGTQTDVLRVGDTAVLDLDTADTGSLTLWCTLPGHRSMGGDAARSRDRSTMTRPRGGRTASSALHGRCRTLQRPLSIVTNGGSVGAAMRRFWNVVTGLSVVVAAHAVTAGLVHLLPGDSMSGTHRVHVPLATLAILLAPLSAIAAERRSRVSRAKAWPRVLLLMAFLLIEAGATHGVGAQLFHDPWVLLAPAAVVLVQKGTCLLSDAVVELLGGIGSPSGGVTPHRHRGARHARAAVRRGLLDPRRGRAPPLPLC